jgi:acetate kinase
MDTILVVNAGSSSVKFQLYGINRAGEPRVWYAARMWDVPDEFAETPIYSQTFR